MLPIFCETLVVGAGLQINDIGVCFWLIVSSPRVEVLTREGREDLNRKGHEGSAKVAKGPQRSRRVRKGRKEGGSAFINLYNLFAKRGMLC